MIPLILSFVSICIENLEIFFIIAIFQSIEFSRSYLSKPTDQFLEYDLFNNGPRQPLRLSYLINPFLKEFVAIFCNSRFIGVFILKP